MSNIISHAKTNTIADWDQQKLDQAVSQGLYPQGTTLADIVLPSDWNNDHVIDFHAATNKTTPVDADEFPIWNSVGSVLGKVTFSNLYNYIKSKLSAAGLVYYATDTFSNLYATYSSTTYNGCVFRCTDFGLGGSDWIVVAGVIKPKYNTFCIAVAAYPTISIQSGTIATGNSGHLTLGSALPKIYSGGAWCYFKATATCTPNLPAGLYFCIFSSTTVCTIYTSGPGSAAFNFSGGGAYTGENTGAALATALSVSCPAHVFGLTGGVDIKAMNTQTSNATFKGIYAYLNSSTLSLASVANVASNFIIAMLFRNAQSESAQVSPSRLNSANNPLASTYNAENTRSQSTVSYGIFKSGATDYVLIEQCEFWYVGG